MLYLGAGNKLYYPNGEMTIGACRAVFQLNGITEGDSNWQGKPASTDGVRALVLRFGEDPSTQGDIFGEDASTLGVATPLSTGRGAGGEASWHALDGRRLSGKPTAKGLYINNGKKVIIK